MAPSDKMVRMFGLGPLEIAAVLGLFVLCLGLPRAARLLGRAFRARRQVDEVRGRLRTPFSLKEFLVRRGRDWISRD
jgi:Sec-independent protein translocase protein TatA